MRFRVAVGPRPPLVVELDVPSRVGRRLRLHLEEQPVAEAATCHVQLEQVDHVVDFPPARNQPYLGLVPNDTRSCPGFDSVRYGRACRTIWRPHPRRFRIHTRLEADEGAVLDCIRDLWTDNGPSDGTARMHGSIVQVGDRAVLIVGPCRSGKTTLAVRMLEQLPNAKLIGDGVCLLEGAEEELVAHYWPRPIYVRFALLFSSVRLERAFASDSSRAEATQLLDRATLARILEKRTSDVDLSLTIARRRFGEALGASTLPSARVGKVIFVGWQRSAHPRLERVPTGLALDRLRANEFPQDLAFGRIERQPSITPPACSRVRARWLRGLEAWSLDFDGWASLHLSLLEDLV